MANKYTSLKIFHYPEKIASLPQDTQAILPPVHIRIKPTNACNHRCSYCAYRAEDLQLGSAMDLRDTIPWEAMERIIQDIVHMGVKAVTFSGGGEPLLYPHMGKVLQRLVDSPIAFATLTNGALLQGEIARLFARHGTWVRISMDGWDPESYAVYRGVSQAEFGKVLGNIERFKSLEGPCLLGVSYIVDHRNAAHVYEMTARLAGLGVDSIKISPCIVSNSGRENNDYHRPHYEEVRQQIERAVRDFASPRFEIFDAYHELDEKFDKNYDWCPYCQILPVIGADMNVYTCQDKAYNDKGLIGAMGDQGFKTFWENGKDKFFQVVPSRDCAHHCVANRKNRIILEYLNADPDHLGFV